MKKVRNPIPGGWCSDPSILRVGEDYYIAASTFEWMPGVSIYHSRDLIHWERLPGALQDDVWRIRLCIPVPTATRIPAIS